jgi:spore maturation protein CgeB
LKRMYMDIERRMKEVGAEVLLVDTCPPYHPEFLRKLNIYKVLRIADGPVSAYDRDFAYLHAYDHILYHSPAYSRDMGMADKLCFCGAKNIDFWPLAYFNALCDPSKTDKDILSTRRDIDVIFIGALHVNKMQLIAAVKKALGRRLRLHGLAGLKKNVYFNFKYGFPGWVTPVPVNSFVLLYQRAKIGINVHNRGDYTVGNYRLFDLPANGVMQISDGGQDLEQFFSVEDEVISYRDADDLIDKVEYYLTHDDERERIALNGFRRVRKDYMIASLLRKAGDLIKKGMKQSNFK